MQLGFQYRHDAVRFERQLSGRLEKFGLAVAPEKTRTLQFNRYVPEPNEAFEFLGFEFRWVKHRTGEMGVKRRTSPKKFRASVRAFTEWVKEFRHSRVTTLLQAVSRKLRGYWNYYGVRGNAESLSRFYDQCQRLLFKWLNRRSQRRSCSWMEFAALMRRHAVPIPRIVELPYQRPLL
jgi:RNA-directed DNA polymerase